MKKVLTITGMLSLFLITACNPTNISSSGSQSNNSIISSGESTTEIEKGTHSFEVPPIPEDIKFPEQLWHKTYTFLDPNMPYEFGFVFQFKLPYNRVDSSVRVYDYQGFVNDFNDYYYGHFRYEDNDLYFTFTDAKNKDVIKMHWDGKDIYLDEYIYEYSENITYPSKGVRVKMPDEKN